MYMCKWMKFVHLYMQCIMSQYQFSDEERRKEFLDLLFAFLTLKGTYSMYMYMYIVYMYNAGISIVGTIFSAI